MIQDAFGILRTLHEGTGGYYSLPALEVLDVGFVSRPPFSIRVVLEALLRNCDGETVTQEYCRMCFAS
jgi:aconitate hydratase